MEKQFVTYEIALKLKELGFSEPCLAWYLPEIAEKGNICTPILGSCAKDWNKMFKDRLNCPLWQQAIDWFREKHNLHISVLPFKLNDKYDDVKLCWYYVVIDINRDGNITLNADSLNPSIENFNSYEEAREQAILKSIELCQKEK